MMKGENMGTKLISVFTSRNTILYQIDLGNRLNNKAFGSFE